LGRTTPTFLWQIGSAIYCPLFGKVWLSSVREAWQWSRKQNLRMVGKHSGSILCRLWTKDHEIFRRCRRPSYFSTPLPGCLYYVLFRRYSQL